MNMAWQPAPGANPVEQKKAILRMAAEDISRGRVGNEAGRITQDGMCNLSFCDRPPRYELLLPAPLRDVGKEPRQGDKVNFGGGMIRTVYYTDARVVVYECDDGIWGALPLREWLGWCSKATKITRVEDSK